MARTARSKKHVEESFGERLARLRKARGYTQTELGEILDGLLASQKLNSRGTRR